MVQTLRGQVGSRHESGKHGLPPTTCAASCADNVRTVSRLKESLLPFVCWLLFAFLFIVLSLVIADSRTRRTAAHSVNAHADKTRPPKGFPNKSSVPAQPPDRPPDRGVEASAPAASCRSRRWRGGGLPRRA